MQCLPKRSTLSSSSMVALAVHPNLPNALLRIPSSSALHDHRFYRNLAAGSRPTQSTATAAARRPYIPSAAAATSTCNSAQQETHQQGLQALAVHCNEQLLLLGQLVDALHAARPQSGPQLLELLSEFDIIRSNLLRPAGYFADFLQQPEEQQPWKQLVQRVGQLTDPVYANSAVLQLLLETIAQGLQQLAAAVAETAAKEDQHLGESTRPSSSHATQVACGNAWQRQFVDAQPGLAVAAGAVHAAAELAQRACKLLQTNMNGTRPQTAGAALKLAALQMCLTAVDAAVNSSIPTTSTKQHGTKTHSSSSSTMQQLMVCRRLLAASWLPPLAAAAAAAMQQQDAANQTRLNLVGLTEVQDTMQHAATQQDLTDSGGGSLPNCHAVKPTTRQLLRSALATLSAISNSTVAGSTVAPLLLMTDDQADVIRPLLKDAGLEHTIHPAAAAAAGKQPAQQASMSNSATAILQSRSSSDTITPWVPLHGRYDQQQHLPQPQGAPSTGNYTPPATALDPEGGSSLSLAAQQCKQNAEAPSSMAHTFQSSVLHPKRLASCNAHGSMDHEVFAAVQGAASTTDGDSGGVLVQTHALLRVHEGADGLVQLGEGLLSMTDHAEQLLHYWQQEQQSHQQQQQQCNASIAVNADADCRSDVQATDASGGSSATNTASLLLLPTKLPLQLLRLSIDVIQVLLRHHPHPGVRQQIYRSGLLPQLQLQQLVLAVVLGLRQRLASEHAATSYTQLVLSGSVLGTAAVAQTFLAQLQPVFRSHAENEYLELQQIATRRARAQGRWGEGDLQPWDVAHAVQQLAQQVTDLDWGRDFAPYFTLPGLIARVNSLLASTCGLRLQFADEFAEGAAAAEGGGIVTGPEQQQQQQQRRLTVTSKIQPWGDHVLHLVLADAVDFAECGQVQQQQQVNLHQQQQLVLGHVFVELVSGRGFPSCSLLQLPAAAAETTTTTSSSSSRHGMSADGRAAAAPTPGSVVIRLPIAAAEPLVRFGSKQSRTSQQQQQHGEDAQPLMLPGPAALQALLHELGHALSYLCPYGTLQQQFASGTAGCSVSNSSSLRYSSHTNSSNGRNALNCSADAWMLNRGVGVHGLCLLAGPADGLDTRELSSHIFEHWIRHPTSLVALSCHERLGAPLPQRAALQLPQMLLAASGACGSMHLHHLLLEAAADLELHSRGIIQNSSSSSSLHFHAPSSTAPKAEAAADLPLSSVATGSSSSSSGSSSSSSTSHLQASTTNKNQAITAVPMLEQQQKEAPSITDTATAPFDQGFANLVTEDLTAVGLQTTQQHASLSAILQDVRTALRQQLVLRGGAVVEEVDELAASGPVGGAKAAYIMAKLLAAAAWKSLGLEQQPTGTDTQSSRGSVWRGGLDAPGGTEQGGRRLKDVLLSSGSFQPGHWTVMQLLGADSDVLQPVFRPIMMQCPSVAGDVQQQAGVPDQASSTEQPTEVGSTANVAGKYERLAVVGWLPNLVHDVYQDVDLV